MGYEKICCKLVYIKNITLHCHAGEAVASATAVHEVLGVELSIRVVLVFSIWNASVAILSMDISPIDGNMSEKNKG